MRWCCGAPSRPRRLRSLTWGTKGGQRVKSRSDAGQGEDRGWIERRGHLKRKCAGPFLLPPGVCYLYGASPRRCLALLASCPHSLDLALCSCLILLFIVFIYYPFPVFFFFQENYHFLVSVYFYFCKLPNILCDEVLEYCYIIGVSDETWAQVLLFR